MPRKSPLSWFYTLELPVQAKLLAHPHGYLPATVAADIPRRARRTYHGDTPQAPRHWHLRSAEAIFLEEERMRLAQWWKRLSDATRSALLRHRTSRIPAQYQQAVFDLEPDGAPPGIDTGASFELPGIAAAYIEMLAGRADPR